MTDALTVLAFALACAGLNLLRGWDLPVAGLRKLAYGLAVAGFIAWQSDLCWSFVLAYSCLFALGSAPGWGRPMGEALGGVPNRQYEWWQGTKALTQTKYALLFRGCMWTGFAVPALLFGCSPLVLLAVPAMTVAFWAAPYITVALAYQTGFRFEYRWKVAEGLCGAIFGLLLGTAAVLL